jgi:WhiB family transcriptional regulator, redox-sensing transcriptional regulator
MTTATRYPADWRSAGACLTADPDIFFPISSAGRASEQIVLAKAICKHCPVQRKCLDFAQEHALAYGIWGGTTPEDRQRALRRQRRASRAGQVRALTVPDRSSALSG